MNKLKIDEIPWEEWQSPSGAFRGSFREISIAMGATREGAPGAGGHPFDLALERLPPGYSACPYHDHAAQWEMFHILAGEGTVRVDGERHAVRPGDTILHRPGEAHQIVNTGTTDLVYFIIADNPAVDICR